MMMYTTNSPTNISPITTSPVSSLLRSSFMSLRSHSDEPLVRTGGILLSGEQTSVYNKDEHLNEVNLDDNDNDTDEDDVRLCLLLLARVNTSSLTSVSY